MLPYLCCFREKESLMSVVIGKSKLNTHTIWKYHQWYQCLTSHLSNSDQQTAKILLPSVFREGCLWSLSNQMVEQTSTECGKGLINLEAVKTLVCWEETKLDWISEYDVAMAEVWINSSDEVEDVVQMAGASELEVVADDIVIPVDEPLAFTAAVWLWDIGLQNGMLVWKIVIAFVTIKYLSCFESRYDAVRSRRRYRNKKYSRPFCLSYFSRWRASCKISLSWTDFVVGSK